MTAKKYSRVWVGQKGDEGGVWGEGLLASYVWNSLMQKRWNKHFDNDKSLKFLKTIYFSFVSIVYNVTLNSFNTTSNHPSGTEKKNKLEITVSIFCTIINRKFV